MTVLSWDKTEVLHGVGGGGECRKVGHISRQFAEICLSVR